MKTLFTPWNSFLIATIMIMAGVALSESIAASLIVGGGLLILGVLGRHLANDRLI